MELKRFASKLIIILAVCSPLVRAQDDPCADPKAFRVGIYISTKEPLSSSDVLEVRAYNAERRLRESLAKQLIGACIVRDTTIFSDPKNYPLLQGSTIIRISARPSIKNKNVAAIAVELSATQGPYVEQSLQMGFIPLLIEDDSDFDLGAKLVMRYWDLMAEQMEKKPPKDDAKH